MEPGLGERPDMSGKICLITGATHGIGRVTARELAAMGATVVLGGRDRQRAEDTVAWIRQQTGNPAVEYLLADLSVQAEVRRLAGRFLGRHPRLDVLVNNAGGFFPKRRETAEGIELTFALNHLAPFLLTHLLLDTLRGSAPSRVVNVSSRAHVSARAADLPAVDRPEGRQRYSGWAAYNGSKLASLLFTYELARRLEGSGVTANVLHPGFVATGFAADLAGSTRWLFALMQRFLAVTPQEGARTSVYLASSPEVAGVSGRYFVDCRPVPSSPASLDPDAARRLWELSARLTRLPVTV